MEAYQSLFNDIKPEDFIRLRRAVGWHVPDVDAASEAISHSLFSVSIHHSGQCVGYGRVVGDGFLVFHVQDIMVLPDHQRKGLGSRIMAVIMDYIRRQARPGAFIALFSAPGLEAWYARYGFIQRPTDSRGPGMAFFKE